jgi:hypothetical protein
MQGAMEEADEGLRPIVGEDVTDSCTEARGGCPFGKERGKKRRGKKGHIDGDEEGPVGESVELEIGEGGLHAAEGTAEGVEVGDSAVGAFEALAVSHDGNRYLSCFAWTEWIVAQERNGAEGIDGAAEEGASGEWEHGLVLTHAGAEAAGEDIGSDTQHEVRPRRPRRRSG